MQPNGMRLVLCTDAMFTHLHQQLQPCDSLERKNEERGKRQASDTWMFLQQSHGLSKRLVSLSAHKFPVD